MLQNLSWNVTGFIFHSFIHVSLQAARHCEILFCMGEQQDVGSTLPSSWTWCKDNPRFPVKASREMNHWPSLLLRWLNQKFREKDDLLGGLTNVKFSVNTGSKTGFCHVFINTLFQGQQERHKQQHGENIRNAEFLQIKKQKEQTLDFIILFTVHTTICHLHHKQGI